MQTRFPHLCKVPKNSEFTPLPGFQPLSQRYLYTKRLILVGKRGKSRPASCDFALTADTKLTERTESTEKRLIGNRTNSLKAGKRREFGEARSVTPEKRGKNSLWKRERLGKRENSPIPVTFRPVLRPVLRDQRRNAEKSPDQSSSLSPWQGKSKGETSPIPVRKRRSPF